MFSQTVNEKFDDYELLTNPTWYGHIDSISIYSSGSSSIPSCLLPCIRVSCNGSSANSIYISTSNQRSFSTSATEWSFWARVPSATSGNNAKIYLIADRQDLLDPQLNGYYVSLGLQNKKLTLYKQTGSTTTVLINGNYLNISNSSNYFRIKVTRDASGNWEMYSDTTAKGSSTQMYYPWNEGSGFNNDNTYDNSSWFGMVTTYTSGSSSKNFYFDNFYSGPVINDTVAPTASISVSKPFIFVKFNESVNITDATDINNYCILELPSLFSIPCTPDSVVAVSGTNNTYKIVYNYPLSDDKVYNLVVKNIKDLSGNTMITDTFTFAFHKVQTYDIVINEIMADPDPPVGLPKAEYVELYNKTDFPIDLTSWKFSYGSGPTTKTFSAVTMQPHSYLIISCENMMNTYGLTAPLFASSCTSSITNSGTTLILTDANGNLIHTVTYSDSWFSTSNKKNGGWSLEQINPYNPCGGQSNWKESVAAEGGTPGKLNSVNAANADNSAPEIAHIGVNALTSDRFYVYFNEPLIYSSFNNISKFKVMLNGNDLGNPSAISPDFPAYSSATFYMPASHPKILPANIYQLVIIDSVFDCAGNMIITNSSANFALPEDAEPGDIIINEILSYPPDGCSNYVEIYNKSNKIINLGTLILGTWDSIAQVISNPKNISEENHLIFPAEYYCLSTNPDAVKQSYYTSNPKGFIKMSSMPSYNNNDGTVTIGNKNLQLMDKLTYRRSMHLPTLTSIKGISLERISFDRATEDPSNWHSASHNAGYGTPAYKNSQYAEFTFEDSPFTITPEIFSPDNDGYNDVLGILYKFDEPGYHVEITIYDSKGRLVKKLVKKEVTGTEGTFLWNGINENNEKAGIGIYIIYSEVKDLQGKIKKYKNTAVLGGKF